MAEIIVAGGTFEKNYFDDGSVGFHDVTTLTAAEAILAQARSFSHAVHVAFLIDSLDMYDEHREELRAYCEASTHDDIVVVHGTDTMVDTARVLADAELDKTIAVTGAMRPHRLGESDASFNLGFALASAVHLPSGVYVAMDGEVFDPHHVAKDIRTGTFNRTHS
jgi:L-asparaginase